MINQRQNLGILSEMKGHFKRNVLATTKLVELGDRGRQESEGTCLCLPSYRLILIDFFFFFLDPLLSHIYSYLFWRTTLYFVLFLLAKMNSFVLSASEFFPCLHLQNTKKGMKFVPFLG